MSVFLKSAAKYGWPFALVIVLWYIALRATPCWYGAPEGSAEFGDMFGAINALFSGLAFAGVLVALFMQKEDLRNQQREIEKQNKTLARQQFEATFFQLLGLINEEEAEIYIESVPDESGPTSILNVDKKAGRPSTELLSYNAITGWLKCQDETGLLQGHEMLAAFASEFFGKDQFGWHAGSFLRLIEDAIEYIENTPLENKKFYLKVIEDMVSIEELTLLFFYASLSEHKELKDSLTKYSMLFRVQYHNRFWTKAKRYGWDPKAFEAFNPPPCTHSN